MKDTKICTECNGHYKIPNGNGHYYYLTKLCPECLERLEMESD